MPRSNFDDAVILPTRGNPLKVSGPVPAGETLKWIWVWVFQNKPSRAAARGYGGAFNGPKWEVTLQMAPNSSPFTPGRAALGTALARVDDGGGAEEIYWWSEVVRIRNP
jgi:hypothetical protein